MVQLFVFTANLFFSEDISPLAFLGVFDGRCSSRKKKTFSFDNVWWSNLIRCDGRFVFVRWSTRAHTSQMLIGKCTHTLPNGLWLFIEFRRKVAKCYQLVKELRVYLQPKITIAINGWRIECSLMTCVCQRRLHWNSLFMFSVGHSILTAHRKRRS